MSLINEALKKAQQVQTESEATSAVATQASSSLSTPSATGSGQSDIFKVLLGVMMFTIIITSFIAFLVISIMDRNSEGGQIVVMPQQPVSVKPAQQSSLANDIAGGQSQATVSDNTDSIASDSINSSQSDVSSNTNVTATHTGDTLASTQSPGTDGVNPQLITSVAPASSIDTQTKSSIPVSITDNSLSIDGDRDKPNPASIAYVKQMHIRGIRISDRNSKILMGNKVFGVDSIINNELNLRVKEIKPREVILIDDDGFIYSKQF